MLPAVSVCNSAFFESSSTRLTASKIYINRSSILLRIATPSGLSLLRGQTCDADIFRAIEEKHFSSTIVCFHGLFDTHNTCHTDFVMCSGAQCVCITFISSNDDDLDDDDAANQRCSQ